MALIRTIRGAPRPEADTYVVSYPKVGRTWLRALVGKALVDHYRLPPEQVLDTERLVAALGLPALGFDHDGSGMMGNRTSRDLSPDKSAFRTKRVLLLGRDVRDTLVSAYFHATRRIGEFSGPIGEFVRDERFGVEKVLTFYRHWDHARAVPREFAFLRYETLHVDPVPALRRVLDFLGAREVPDAALDAAVRFARFDNLRQAEADGRYRSPALRAAAGSDPESYKVRKGKVGGYRDYLDDADVAWIDACEAARGCEFTRPWTLPPR